IGATVTSFGISLPVLAGDTYPSIWCTDGVYDNRKPILQAQSFLIIMGALLSLGFWMLLALNLLQNLYFPAMKIHQRLRYGITGSLIVFTIVNALIPQVW